MNKKEKKDVPVAEKPSDCNGDRVTVSKFDNCVGNYFRANETISKLRGEDDEDYYALQQTEIQRLSSSLTFLRPCCTRTLLCMLEGMFGLWIGVLESMKCLTIILNVSLLWLLPQ
ncbi:uncharacterized protein LOC115980000 [Quercus lobata]|uniref:uncharacterized protein LOC115980000 n=1 Tax=Quercus lobata TaxID=97700 RepID=UPI001247D867|nr:uncharacterized protein LOC115980000 [Quercus lobata]